MNENVVGGLMFGWFIGAFISFWMGVISERLDGLQSLACAVFWPMTLGVLAFKTARKL